MRIDLIYPSVAPRLDAIGQYTTLKALELLRGGAQVRLWTARDPAPDPVPGLDIRPAFDRKPEGAIRELLPALLADPPDWVMLEWNPYAYGYLGWCPGVVALIRSLRRRAPKVRIALMVHEAYIPFGTSRKGNVLTQWQQPFYRAIGRAADLIAYSTPPWIARDARWFPGIKTVSWPIGSNMPRVPVTRAEARARLGIPDEVLAVGFFGTTHHSRMVESVRGAITAARSAGLDARMLYIGAEGEAVCAGLDHEPLRAEGPLPDDEVSRRFSAMDVHLAPYSDGAAARRTAMMTGLQHGIATVSTLGPSTDPILRQADGEGLVLAPVDSGAIAAATLALLRDAALREKIACGGQKLFDENFSWAAIRSQVLNDLESCPPRR